VTADPYLIPGTATLRNLVGITDPDELARFETNVSVARIVQLRSGFRLPGRPGWDLEHLKAVHRHIFQDVYDWAGTVRTVAISKDEDFHPLLNPLYAQGIFERLHADDLLQSLDRSSFVRKLSQLESDLFALHPFREGNTRSTTTFVTLVADQAGWRLDWSACDPARFQEALRASYRAGEVAGWREIVGLVGEITSRHEPSGAT
jgi:cell filamentation protein